jgi:DNA (cytosine-5)-methyltransferase 1
MAAFYNEIDPFAAQTLRNLIANGHIAPGVVDERDIQDILPEELNEFTQCHFFAGVGVWSYALRQAGWPDDRPVWTGSCPCQPFSAAGKGDGFDDERHLWPAFHHLIAQCRPAVVVGEQVASKAVDAWIDLVHADLEGLGYAFGSVPFPSAGVGAPHIRDRNYWAADAHDTGLEGRCRVPKRAAEFAAWAGGVVGGLAYTRSNHDASEVKAASARQPQANRPTNLTGGRSCTSGGLGDAHSEHAGRDAGTGDCPKAGSELRGCGDVPIAPGAADGTGPTNGFWRDADWIGCRDGKWRPVEPGTFPLAHGAASRVGRLRAYGNAINAKAAQAFIESLPSGLSNLDTEIK